MFQSILNGFISGQQRTGSSGKEGENVRGQVENSRNLSYVQPFEIFFVLLAFIEPTVSRIGQTGSDRPAEH